MADFFTLLTTTGSNRLANALVLGETVDFAEMALGDGNGNPVTPLETMTVLTHEVYRAAVNSITVDSENPNQIICEMIVPAATGGWYIREVGIYATDGTLLAVGNFPETYKPTLAEGSGRDLVIRIILLVNNTGVVNLVINPDTVIASQAYVAEQINAHEAAANPHPGKFAPANHTHTLNEYGMTLANNAVDSEHDIDISPGRVIDSTNSSYIELDSILTKHIDINWSEGTLAGGMATGIYLEAFTWYHIFSLFNPANQKVDAGADISITAANLRAGAAGAAGYTKYRYIGSVLTDANANIIPFFQYKDYFYWKTRALDFSSSTVPDTRTLQAISTPLDVNVRAFLQPNMDGNATSDCVIITSPYEDDQAPSPTGLADLTDSGYPSGVPAKTAVVTNTSSQIAWRFPNTSMTTAKLYTIGYQNLAL